MNKMKMRFFISLCILSLFYSCSDINQKKQIEKVKALHQEVIQIDQELLNNFPDSISKMRLSMMQLELKIKQSYLLDSIDISFAKKMDDYKGARKSLKKLNKQYVLLKKAVKEELNALENLEADIQSGLGKRNKYDKFIKSETSKTAQLKSLFKDLNGLKTQIFSTYRLLHPQLLALSNSIKKTP